MSKSLFEYGAAEEGEILAEFQSSLKTGLSDEAVEEAIKRFGLNKLHTSQEQGIVMEFLGHFKSPLVIILIFASIISFLVGDRVNALIIQGIVLMSAVLDFFEEKSAHNAAKKLRESVRIRILVVRAGIEKEILSEELVPGDVIRLNAGKVVPADVRVLQAKDFFVNQSSLTGESFPVEKRPGKIPLTTQIDELTNLALMGSSVVSGSMSGIVVRTGMTTHFGSIARKLVAPSRESSFSRGVRDFGYLVMRITMMLIVVIFLINGVLRQDWLEAFMFALAVAVGLAPELLTMIMSVSMARGSLRMAKKGAIVKKLTSIPNFGSMDVLCTDKTGTLTQDKIVLVKHINLRGDNDEDVLKLAYANSLFQSGMKNPLDDSLLEKKVELGKMEKIDEVPFDFYRRRMSVVVKSEDKLIMITKGAPEEVLKVCRSGPYEGYTGLYEDLSRDGFKVLAIATREMTSSQKTFSKEDETGLEPRGFVAFLDPPKPEAYETIRSLHDIGIQIKIITGDNHLVALKICKEIGLEVNGWMLGEEMDRVTDEALKIKASETTLFARFSPDQKNRVIQALQAHHTVGYMGDGINDAPSLKTADVGISVNNATDVAKESADIILTDKSLMILADGVMEGRTTFANTLKYIQMGLSSNFGNMFSMAAAALFLPFLPMLPVQILLNNFIYDFSQVTIPTDRVDEHMIRQPQKWNLAFLKKFMIVFGLVSSLFDLLTFYFFYKVFGADESQFQTAWFLESLTTQSLVIFLIRSKLGPFRQSLPSRPLVLSTTFCIILSWLIPYTFLGTYVKMVPLPINMVLAILILVVVYLVIVELTKHAFYRWIDR